MFIFAAQDWFASPLGQYLLLREQAYFDEVVTDIFGFNALQLGLAQYDLLRSSRIPTRITVDPNAPVQLRAAPEHLPISSHSIDLLLLPHVLEFSASPHQILREVERVLIPEGHVVISGFNPFSLWGLRRLFSQSGGEYPWRGNFIALPRLKDWLALLNLEVVAGRLCCYAPPFQSEQWLHRCEFMDAAGDRWWALAGGVYFILARKRVHSMRLIMPGWSERMAARKNLVPAAQQTATRRSTGEQKKLSA